jgi:ribosome recycling factor
MNKVLNEMKAKMEQTLVAGEEELRGIQTGRANTALLNRVQVDYYGTFVPLQQLGTITVLDASTLQISAYDKQSVAAIEKSISGSNLGLRTSSEGQVVRVTIPPLSEERRAEYVKLAKSKGENIKIQLRNHRHDAKNKVAAMRKSKEIGEDDERGFENNKLNPTTKEFTDKAEVLVNEKVKELNSF